MMLIAKELPSCCDFENNVDFVAVTQLLPGVAN